MDYNKIQLLLDKYWEGETTLAEEQLLKNYFNGGEVATELQVFTPLFQYLKKEDAPVLDEHFDRQLIARLERSTPPGRVASLNPVKLWLSRAAAVLVLLTALFYLQKAPVMNAEPQVINWSEKETLSPEEAWEQTRRALELVSRKLNKGSEGASKGMSKVRSATRIIKN